MSPEGPLGPVRSPPAPVSNAIALVWMLLLVLTLCLLPPVMGVGVMDVKVTVVGRPWSFKGVRVLPWEPVLCHLTWWRALCG